MAPVSSLTNVLNSPGIDSDDSTFNEHKTLPDVSLGSLGSSFRSDDQEEGRKVGRTPVSRPPRLAAIRSPETSASTNIATPSPTRPPTSALLSLSPPPTVRRASSHSALPPRGSQRNAPRRNSTSSVSSAEDGGALETRYADETGDDAVLSTLSINISPRLNGGRKSYGAVSKHGGRHSVAADVSGTGPLTLRDQEQQLNAAKKDIFNLQLENHFLKERLSNMAPDHIEAALTENVKLKLEILNLSKEMKKVKKILTQQDRDLAEAQQERQMRGSSARGGNVKEVEEMYRAEKERRKALERQVEEEAVAREAAEEELDRVRGSMEGQNDEAEKLRADIEDQAEEMDRLRDRADRAEDELDKLKSGLGESVGLRKGRDERMLAKLEEENEALQLEIEQLRAGAGGDAEELEERMNELMDKLAAAQLDVDQRDLEIEQLNEELDVKVRDHEKEIQQVEAEWRGEVLEARAQVDELKDAMEQREQDMKDVREMLLEREDELAIANERIAELQAVQAETHDRLEETLKNIEKDNAEKDADLIEANREVEALGQRVYDLEEACDELKAREQQLDTELRSADEAFDQAKTHYETLVTALKEARKKLQDERDEAVADARDLESRAIAERENSRREKEVEIDKIRRTLAEREQVNARLQGELDAARDRVTQRDRDLSEVQGTLRSLETEKRKLGDEGSTTRHGLELEIDRVERDLISAEDDLQRAREEVERGEARLRQKDVELANMLDKQRDLENRLASERQGRLNISDKLDVANKNARQYEREANNLRERIEELEPLLTETQQEQFKIQRQSEQQRQDRSELLLRVFKDVNRFLGTDDSTTPANFPVFRDTLLTRLRSMIAVRTDFEKRVRETEASVDQRMGALKRQLESKWKTLDNFENSVKKLDLTRLQWKQKYALKEGELEAAKSRNAELSQHLSSLRAGSSTSDSSQIRSLTERALSAEKRASRANNQLEQLEAKLAELQNRAGQAEDKWAARVKEYENRLRIAGEKIKTEKQGGKERARQLEEQVRALERQVDGARNRNRRAEGVVATAQHLLDSP